MLGKLKPSTLILPDIPKDARPQDVKKILQDFSHHLREEVLPLMENIEVKTQRVVSTDGALQTSLLQTTSGGGGDIILQEDRPVYLSLVL